MSRHTNMVIKHMFIDNGSNFVIIFDDETYLCLKTKLKCCEDRFFQSDDDFDYFIGASYISWCEKDVFIEKTNASVHEIQFIEIATNRGTFQIKNYNIHTGAYSGFNVETYFGNTKEISCSFYQNNTKNIVTKNTDSVELYYGLYHDENMNHDISYLLVAKDNCGNVYAAMDIEKLSMFTILAEVRKVSNNSKHTFNRDLNTIIHGKIGDNFSMKKINALYEITINTSID